ncbi:POC1 centriolar B [Phytophthora citrophthora]|uniref:POC1 centriolar B n=1 Tax=Phytophthora citrophthora TaxID=4793 RepID=A0AAD9LAP7_9STRA|nr:POC1 centriolar B [Phytophthora citrophthora]
MVSILDFFKPLTTIKRPREEPPVVVKNEGPSAAAPTTTNSSSEAQSQQRNSQLKAESVVQKLLNKRQMVKNKSQTVAAAGLDQGEEERFAELSAYEQKRLVKMAANAQFLQEVGMVSAQLNMTRQLQQDRTPHAKPAKRRSKTKPLPEELPVRRSKRIRGEAAPGSKTPPRVKVEDEEEDSPGPDPHELEASFAESKVLRYSVNGDEDVRKAPVSLQDSPDRDLVGFQVDAKSYLYDHSINKTYDISFTPFQDNSLVAAGGHAGLVSIFPFSNSFHQPEIADGFVDDPGAHIPLMSFKAHNGWISAVSLARSIQGKANLLLTASNDASVKLWDLNHSSALLSTPKLVFSNTDLHNKGIFGMDVCGDSVLTCSKDKTVVLSQLRGGSGQLEMKQRFEEHVGVVKCVRFARCNPQIFASAGNDRELRVFDARVAMNPNVVTIGGVHSRAINSVQFHPTDDNLLLSAGFDPDFYLFDVRNTSTPVCTFHQSDDTSKGIFHPIFVRNGLGVVAARGHQLSLYRTSDGVTISRGYIDAAATCIAADPFYDRITIAQGGKLQFADAKWKSSV